MTDDQPAPGSQPEDQLKITRRPSDDTGTLTLALDGDLDPFTAPLLSAELDGSLGDGIQTLELDLAGVRFLDSSGLRVLVVAQNELAPRGGRVVLVGATSTTRRVLELAGLDTSFTLQP
jgi:anti-anti-sigma factor